VGCLTDRALRLRPHRSVRGGREISAFEHCGRITGNSDVTRLGKGCTIGLLGVRLPFALIVGYPLHGLWDLLHELQAHGAYSAFEPGQLTAIPLAYGVFCAAFDFCIAAYFYARRADWSAAWKAVPHS